MVYGFVLYTFEIKILRDLLKDNLFSSFFSSPKQRYAILSFPEKAYILFS